MGALWFFDCGLPRPHTPALLPQGVDWRDAAVRALHCNQGRNPLSGDGWNDGVNVDPLEVMFVKVRLSRPARAHCGGGSTRGHSRPNRHCCRPAQVKAPMLAWPHVATAVKMAQWARASDEAAGRARAGLPPSAQHLAALACNDWRPAPPSVVDALRAGPACWDADYYVDANPDLAFLRHLDDGEEQAYRHFRGWGFWEGRPFRTIC